jgi:hypothetical protein
MSKKGEGIIHFDVEDIDDDEDDPDDDLDV